MSVQTSVFENGQWVTGETDIYEILRREQERQAALEQQTALPNKATRQQPIFGILSRTILRSPIINWIIPARVRNRERNDVVFIGEDFVHLKEILSNGHLRHVATKADLGARIRSARVFGEPRKIIHPPLEYNWDHTPEIDYTEQIPPQILALTLESLELVFLFANERPDGEIDWWKSTVPLEAQKSFLEQPGKHLAVDARSRAVAVSASEKAVFLYSAKTMKELREDFAKDPHNWTPVRFERPIGIAGTILKMEFLYPEPGDENTVILLVVHTNRKSSAISCFEWDCRYGLGTMRVIVEGYPLYPNERMPVLLIPLQHGPNFMLAGEKEIYMHQDIMTGHPKRYSVSIGSDEEPRFPGSSRRKPVWTSWARTGRNWVTVNKTEENFYLMREDGVVHYMQVDVQSNASTSKAGHLECSVDTAFASLDVDYHLATPDVLVAAGDMTSGEIVKIGSWRNEFPQDARQSSPNLQRTRAQVMQPHHITSVQNWAPTMDLIVTNMPNYRAGLRDARKRVLTTAGRAPYGSVMELRHGHDAILDSYFDHEELVSVTSLWTFPDTVNSGLYIIFAFPTHSSLMYEPRNGSEPDTQFDSTNCGLELDHETLLCTSLPGDLGLQITSRNISVVDVANTDVALCRKGLWTFSADEIVIKASVYENTVFLAIRTFDGVSLKSMVVSTPTDDIKFKTQADLPLDADITCLQTLSPLGKLLVATTDGVVRFYRLTHDGLDLENPTEWRMEDSLSQGSPAACHTAVLLEGHMHDDQISEWLLVCGLRNGDLYTIKISMQKPLQSLPHQDQHMTDDLNHGPFMDFASARRVGLGHAPASVIACGACDTSIAVATCGSEVCRLDYRGGHTEGIKITNVWFTDRQRPSLQQFSVSALNQIPLYGYLTRGLGGALIGTSGKTFFVAQLDEELRAVPRRIPIDGTPNRIVYSKYYKTIFVGAVRTVPFSNRPQRASHSIIQMIDDRPGTESRAARTGYELGPGVRIHSLVEWVLRLEDGTRHSLLVVGTTEDEGKAGRIVFLRPQVNEDGELSLKLNKEIKLRYPVFSLASFRDRDLVACVGKRVYIYSYSSADPKFKISCQQDLPSSGHYVNTDSSRIYVSTAEDSMMAFELHSPGPNNLQITRQLVPVFNDSQARVTSCHLPISLRTAEPPPVVSKHQTNGSSTATKVRDAAEAESDHTIILIADKTNSLAGILRPTVQTHQSAAPTLFEASFPRSMTRLGRGSVLPPWRQNQQPGLLVNDIIGSSADGSIYGFSILDERTWKLLRFLQNLCVDEDRQIGDSWPGGIGPLQGIVNPLLHPPDDGQADEDIPNGTSGLLKKLDPDKDVVGRKRKTSYHVDGDVLMRFLGPKGREVLPRMFSRYGDEGSRELEQRFAEVAVDALTGTPQEGATGGMNDMIILWLRDILQPML